jgi:hypothetical protein
MPDKTKAEKVAMRKTIDGRIALAEEKILRLRGNQYLPPLPGQDAQPRVVGRIDRLREQLAAAEAEAARTDQALQLYKNLKSAGATDAAVAALPLLDGDKDDDAGAQPTATAK